MSSREFTKRTPVLQRGFEFVRQIPRELYSGLIAQNKKLKLGPLSNIEKDLPAAWQRILQAEDPRDAIRAAFASPLGSKIADAVTHVGLLRSPKGPQLVYVFVVPRFAKLAVEMLIGTLPVNEPRAKKYPDLDQLFRMHGSLLDTEKHGVFHPNEWWENAGGELDAGDDDGFPEGYRVPNELVRMARPFSADEDDPDAALGYDPQSKVPRAYRIVNGCLEVACDVVSDLEQQVEAWVGAWDMRVDLSHRVLELQPKGKKFKKAAIIKKLVDNDLLVATDGDTYFAAIKTREEEYVVFTAESEEEALLGLQTCPLAMKEASSETWALDDALDDCSSLKLGRVELLSKFGPFPELPTGLARGSSEALRRIVSAGGTVNIPPGKYHLDAPLVIIKPVELHGDGRVLLVSSKKGALVFESKGRSAVRGVAIDATSGLGIDVCSGDVTVEDCVLVGRKVDDEGHYGVHTGGSAKIAIAKTAIRGFWGGVEVNDSATASVTDCRLEHNELGVACSDIATLTVQDARAAFQSGCDFAACNKSRLSVMDSWSFRPEGNAVYADDESNVVVRGGGLFASNWAGIFARDKAQIDISNTHIEGCKSEGIRSENEARLNLRDGAVNRCEGIGIVARDCSQIQIEGTTIEGCHQNSMQSTSIARPASLRAVNVTSRRSGYPAVAAVTNEDHEKGSVVRLQGCVLTDSGTGILTNGSGCRVEATDCTIESGDGGVDCVSPGHVVLTGCTLRLLESHTVLFKEGTWKASKMVVDRCPAGAEEHAGEDEDEDASDEDDEDESDDEDRTQEEPPALQKKARTRLGEISVPSGMLAVTDFSTLQGWNAKKDGRKVRHALEDSEDGEGYGEIPHESGVVVAVRIPEGTYVVWGTRMGKGPFSDNWSVIDLDVACDVPVVKRDCIGSLLVDGARFMFSDVTNLALWKEGQSQDGTFDVCFWGKDEEALASALHAKSVAMHSGWADLSETEAKKRMSELKSLCKSKRWHVVSEIRPNDHHNLLLRRLNEDLGTAATIEIDGNKLCGMFTDWGDGVFPIWREVGADGQVVRVRVHLGTRRAEEIARSINGMDDSD